MRVKCLAQEHNTMTRPGLEPGPEHPEISALTTRPLQETLRGLKGNAPEIRNAKESEHTVKRLKNAKGNVPLRTYTDPHAMYGTHEKHMGM